MNKTKHIKVSIFGDQFTLVSDEAEEHVLAVAKQLDEIMRELATKMPLADAKRLALLVALQAQSKVKELEAMRDKNDQQAKQLIDLIDREMFALVSRRA